MGTETIVKDYVDAHGDTYTITVTFDEKEDLTDGEYDLSVDEILEGTEAYKQYLADSRGAMGIAEDDTVSFARFFDITILKDGEKTEPKYPAQVKIEYANAVKMAETEAMSIVHFVDEENIEVITDVTLSDDGKELVYEQKSFSVVGTVASTNSNYWPDNGIYTVIVEVNGKYYAVKHDGTLTEVIPVKKGEDGKPVYEGEGDDKTPVADTTLTKGGFVMFKDTDVSVLNDGTTDSGDQLNEYEWEVQARLSKDKSGIIGYGYDNYRFRSLNAKNTTGYEDWFDNSTNSASIGNKIPSYGVYLDATGKVQNRSSTGYYLTVDSTTNPTKVSRGNSSSAVPVYFASLFDDGTAITDVAGQGTQGGSSGTDLSAPATQKTLIPNGDGTYQLSLSVTGQSRAQKEKAKADVIIVLDKSGSMGSTGMTNAKNAIRSLLNGTTSSGSASSTITTDGLLYNNKDGEEVVRYSIIQFDSTVRTPTAFSTAAYTDNSTTNGGETNWESALSTANGLTVRQDADTYVIFISDGGPNRIAGSGTEQLYDVAYDNAKEVARKIVSNNKHLYTIYVAASNPEPREYFMEGLTAYAYSGSDAGAFPTDTYQFASETSKLKDALSVIGEAITRTLSYSDVAITDGVTTNTHVAVSGSAGGFTYTVKDKNGNEQTVPANIKTAAYNETEGKVTWDMGEYNLEDGWEYTVSFTVWPDQKIYDAIADANNGDLTAYNALSADEKKAIESTTSEDGTTVYYYKSNTTASVVYSTVKKDENGNVVWKSNPSDPAPIKNPDPQDLTGSSVKVKKLWNDSMYAGNRPGYVDLKLMKSETGIGDWTDYITRIRLTAAGNWLDQKYISPGILLPKAKAESLGIQTGGNIKAVTFNGADYVQINSGHYYKYAESEHYQYQMREKIFHPMLVDGTLLNVSGTADVGYTADLDKDNLNETVTAVNDLRGGLDVLKKIYTRKGEGEQTTDEELDDSPLLNEKYTMAVTFTGDITGFDKISTGESNKVLTATGDLRDVTDNDVGKYAVWCNRYSDAAGTTRTDKVIIILDSDGDNVMDNNGVFNISIKPNELFRFTNLPRGLEYSVTEATESSAKFSKVEITYETTFYADEEGNTHDPVKEEGSGTVYENASNNVTVKNILQDIEIKFLKADSGEGHTLIGPAEFSICRINEQNIPVLLSGVEGVTEIKDENGNLKDTRITVDESGITLKLEPGTYELTEKVSPAGYIIANSGIRFTVKSDETIGYEGNSADVLNKGAIDPYGTEDAKIATSTLRIFNTPGTALPNTGGPGTLLYTLSGLALILASAMMYGFRMRRRERRLN